MAKGLGAVLAKILGGLAKGTVMSARRNPDGVVAQFLIGVFIIVVAVSIVAAIVIAISKAYEKHLLPSLTSRHAKDTHEVINFWLHAYLTIICCLGLLALLGGAEEPDMYESDIDESGDGGFFGFLIIIAALAAYLTAFYQITLRLWAVIPADIARCTPAHAAGYSLIPFYNFYWWFIAFYGLAEDINKTASRYGRSPLLSMDFAKAVCIVWVVDAGIDFFAPELYVPFGVIPNLVFLGVTTAFFIQLRNAATTLLVLKTCPPTGNP